MLFCYKVHTVSVKQGQVRADLRALQPRTRPQERTRSSEGVCLRRDRGAAAPPCVPRPRAFRPPAQRGGSWAGIASARAPSGPPAAPSHRYTGRLTSSSGGCCGTTLRGSAGQEERSRGEARERADVEDQTSLQRGRQRRARRRGSAGPAPAPPATRRQRYLLASGGVLSPLASIPIKLQVR